MKLKSLYLIVCMLLISTVIFAQEKYEQAVVNQFNSGTVHFIYISVEGQDLKKIKVNGDEVSDRFNDYSPLLKQVALMRNDGWEIWNSNNYQLGSGAEGGITYFLKRKLK